jgi:hypothetical protein
VDEVGLKLRAWQQGDCEDRERCEYCERYSGDCEGRDAEVTKITEVAKVAECCERCGGNCEGRGAEVTKVAEAAEVIVCEKSLRLQWVRWS